MRRKKEELNRLELLLTGYIRFPGQTHEEFSSDKNRTFGAYYVENNQYFSYENMLSDKDKELIIRSDMKGSISNALPKVSDELISIYYFMEVKIGQEEDALMALIVDEEYKKKYYEVWGVLSDGSILNANQTVPMLSGFKGNSYHSVEVPKYDIETGQVTM